MRIRSKHLVPSFSLLLLVAATWYFFLYPEEPWIRYNFTFRSSEINALADYLEGQSDFKEFSCIEDDVWLDSTAAPEDVHKELQSHCRTARVVMGERTEAGSFYYLGWRTRWLNDYWIAVIRGTDFDDFPPCSRWNKPRPLESCVVMLSDVWAIHYFNATSADMDVQEFAEDVAKSLFAK